MRLAFAFWGPPIAWFIQLNVNYALASHACYPQGIAMRTVIGGWEWMPTAEIVFSIAVIAICIAAFFVALGIDRDISAPDLESSGVVRAHATRIRFVAVWSELASLYFAAAALFHLVTLIMVPACGD